MQCFRDMYFPPPNFHCASLQMRQHRELPRQVRQIRHARQFRAIKMNGSSLSGIIGQRKTLFEGRGNCFGNYACTLCGKNKPSVELQI